MSVKVRLHPYLRRFTNGQEVVKAVGRTIGECLDDLETKFPGIKQRLRDEQGELLSFYEVYVNSSDGFSPEELSSPVKDGDELMIAPVIAGG